MSSDDLRTAARKTYDSLVRRFEATDNFWRLGQTFDTILDYFAVVTNAEAGNFAPIAYERYTYTIDPRQKQACLYDDFGWWGIAGLKASKSDYFGDEWMAKFAAIAPRCWKTLHDLGAAVWDNKAHQAKWSPLEPRFGGGVWNCTFSSIEVNGDCATPCNPLKCRDCPYDLGCCDIIRGFQNTVTNGLHFILAARLYAATNDGSYKDAADKQYGFFKNWFETTDVAPLLDRDGDQALVRERVSAFAPSSNEPMYGFDPDLAWAGDQGLVLGGLVDRMRYVTSGSDYKDMLGYARQILAGVKDRLAVNGILQPWTGPRSPAGDDGDYCTGIAVCMRYLLYAWQNNSDLYTDLATPKYYEFIRTNARSVMAKPGSCNTDDMANLTNDLAILVLAIAMGTED